MVSGEPVLVIGLVVGWTGSSVVEGEYHAPPVMKEGAWWGPDCASAQGYFTHPRKCTSKMGPSLVASNTFGCRSTGPHKMGPGGIPPGIPLQLTPNRTLVNMSCCRSKKYKEFTRACSA